MMRKRFAFLGVLALVFALFPSVAFALDIWPNGSYWTGTPFDEPGYYAAFVRADNKYDAAVYALGFDPASLSSDVKVKLSDPDYGRYFYDYALTFNNVAGWDEVPDWLPTYVSFFTMTSLVQSFERIYESKVVSNFKNLALADFEAVLAGEDLGGGGSDASLPSSVTLYGNSDFYTNKPPSYYSYLKTGWNGERNYQSFVWTANISDSVVEKASEYIGLYPYVYVYQRFASASWKCGSSTELWLVMSPTPFVNDTLSVTNGGERYLYFKGSGSINTVTTFNFSSTSVYWMDAGENWTTYHWFKPVSAEGDTPAPPSGTWPEPTTPATPDPPEVPTPTAPTETVDPDPTAPTITWPTSPTLVLPTSPIVSTTPEGIDYTALLTLINDNLNSIDSYLQNFYTSFNSFRSDFLNGVDDIVDGLRNIYQYLGHLNNILEVHCKHITDQIEESVYNLELYIKRLFEWLPRQLDFDAQYDDSAVTTLLHRILNKIPGSSGTPVTYKPNPQSDEPGFFDFLADLWHRFLLDLVSVLPDALGGLVDDISQLTHYFPFSIPWDMFALLALFAHDPVTPVFDVPWGYGGGEGEIQMIRVDLSAWDGVMETVRPVFLVGFCMQLAIITKDLLANFDLKQGGV